MDINCAGSFRTLVCSQVLCDVTRLNQALLYVIRPNQALWDVTRPSRPFRTWACTSVTPLAQHRKVQISPLERTRKVSRGTEAHRSRRMGPSRGTPYGPSRDTAMRLAAQSTNELGSKGRRIPGNGPSECRPDIDRMG